MAVSRPARWARRSTSVTIGGLIVVILVLAAVLAQVIAPYDPYVMNPAIRLEPPSARNLLGTDNYGRDLLTRIVFGARVSLVVGLASIVVAAAIGVTIGLISGYLGGWSDLLIMRGVEIVQAFPPLLLALALVSIMEVGIGSVILAVGLVQWTVFARVVRASALALKEEEFVLAAWARAAPHPAQCAGAVGGAGDSRHRHRYHHRSGVELPGPGRAAADSQLGRHVGLRP